MMYRILVTITIVLSFSLGLVSCVFSAREAVIKDQEDELFLRDLRERYGRQKFYVLHASTKILSNYDDSYSREENIKKGAIQEIKVLNICPNEIIIDRSYGSESGYIDVNFFCSGKK